MRTRRWWEPAVKSSGGLFATKPEAGWLIAVERKPYRVIEVRERGSVDWSEGARDAWLRSGMPDPWRDAPFDIVVKPVPGGKARHIGIEPHRHGTRWFSRLPEHYAICASCGELAPCGELTAEREAREEMAHFEELAAILPGCCWACGEPITARQSRLTYRGPNVWMPTAPDGVPFHTRRKCRHGASKYEDDWARADPSRPRTFLTLRCAGTLVVHGDGSAECFGAAESDCPGLLAAHRAYQACYLQSHGCPRGCSQSNHPGCHPQRPPRVLPAEWPAR